jgi:hypothetical protein
MPAHAAFTAKVTNSTDVAGTNPYFTCQAAALAGSTYWTYPLRDATVNAGATATDVSGNGLNGTYQGANLTHAPGPSGCTRDPAGYLTLTGPGSYMLYPGWVYTANPLSMQIWFRTTTPGGYLFGFGTAGSGLSPTTDRIIYMDDAGHLHFGLHPSGYQVLNSPATYADGTWHQVVTTMGTSGSFLYVDGALVASNTAMTTAPTLAGWWRNGYDNLAGWPSAPSNNQFLGSLAWSGGYAYALTATQVAAHYAAGI